MVETIKRSLSGSVDGRQIKVVRTATAGTLIHTASGLDQTSHDEVWLYACNHHSGALILTIEFGGGDSPDDLIVKSLAVNSGAVEVIPGLILTNGLVIRAFAGTGNLITISGWVYRNPINSNLQYRT